MHLKDKDRKFRALISKMANLMKSSDYESDEDQENDNDADADNQADGADDEVEDASSAFFSSLGLSKE